MHSQGAAGGQGERAYHSACVESELLTIFTPCTAIRFWVGELCIEITLLCVFLSVTVSTFGLDSIF